MATYTIRNTSVQDWRDTMMSKAQFDALAAERRANRAGSGFDSFGLMPTTFSSTTEVNSGIVARSFPLIPALGGNNINLFGIMGCSTQINGVVHKVGYPKGIYSNYNYGLSYGEWRVSYGVDGQTITMPDAPTVLPYDATLTPEQIASGVIKHADASNSGLIVNGKGLTGTTFSQSITTVIGKLYIIEWKDNGVYATSTFTATLTSTTVSKTGTNITQIAVFPADAISRSDLVFLESWHEDVSEKDFVYPLGNVQYLGTTGDSGTPVAGAFAGSATYSLFSDTWQADSALVGKGYVWSTMTDAQKKAFVGNPENNCYLDGDKVIQVRYRMRVVAGMGDSWVNVNSIASVTESGGATLKASNFGIYSLDGTVKPKGRKVSLDINIKDIDVYTAGMYMDMGNSSTSYNKSGLVNIGAFTACNSTWGLDTTFGHEGKCYALPIALVHR